MNYLLDTNICVAVLNDRPPYVQEHLKSVLKKGYGVNISVITAFELWFGVYKSQRVEHNHKRLVTLLSGLEILDYDSEDAIAAGKIRAELARQGEPIGPYDLLIAAHALRRGLVLVTNNFREFRRIPDLHIENWIAEC